MAVEFTVQQLELIDQVAKEAAIPREATVQRAVEEMIADLGARDAEGQA